LRYLVTGGAGFVGSHLCDRLSAGGHAITVLDDLSTGRLENIEHLLALRRVELVEGYLRAVLVLDRSYEGDVAAALPTPVQQESRS
jgi:UDP-glucose 4-epimerase